MHWDCEAGPFVPPGDEGAGREGQSSKTHSGGGDDNVEPRFWLAKAAETWAPQS